MATLGPRRLLLGSGAIIGLSRNDARARAVLTTAWEAGVEVCIPSVILAETARGKAADAPVNRVMKAVGEVVPVIEPDGRLAGTLLGACGSNSTIDAIVVAIAIRLDNAVILTSDPSDLSELAASHPQVQIEAF